MSLAVYAEEQDDKTIEYFIADDIAGSCVITMRTFDKAKAENTVGYGTVRDALREMNTWKESY